MWTGLNIRKEPGFSQHFQPETTLVSFFNYDTKFSVTFFVGSGNAGGAIIGSD